MPDTIDDARRLISSRLAELDAESLERALVSLGERSGPRRRRPGRPTNTATAPPKPKRRAVPRRKVGKRATRGQRQAELLDAIKTTPGTRPSGLAKTIGVNPTQIHALITKARAEKLIVKRGHGYALSAKAAS